MKILYAIQGTGNGHLCRAMEILPALLRHASVDVLISGTQSEIDLGHPLKYKLKGMSFIFGKRGGVDIFKTWKRNSLRSIVRELRAVPVKQYDLVINDFEPVTAWACWFRKVPCIALSHQAALFTPTTPKPHHKDWLGSFILRYYAPACHRYGFHFKAYDRMVHTPVIRQEVRNAIVSNKKHYTVYLPAYSDKRIIKLLMEIPEVEWEVFSKHSRRNYFLANVHIHKLDNDKFVRSMATAEGVMCGAGFETPAEALFLGKKLLVIPMRSQYEQHFNAMALLQMNVPVINSLKRKNLYHIRKWIAGEQRIKVNYPDETDQIVERILAQFKTEYAFQELPGRLTQIKMAWKAAS